MLRLFDGHNMKYFQDTIFSGHTKIYEKYSCVSSYTYNKLKIQIWNLLGLLCTRISIAEIFFSRSKSSYKQIWGENNICYSEMATEKIMRAESYTNIPTGYNTRTSYINSNFLSHPWTSNLFLKYLLGFLFAPKIKILPRGISKGHTAVCALASASNPYRSVFILLLTYKYK